MPQKCYYKPNRSEPRRYSRSDAARVICYAIKGGTATGQGGGSANFEAELTTISNLARARCGDGATKDFTAEEVALAKTASYEDSTLQKAYDSLAANSALMLQLLEWFGALITFLSVLIGLARFIPVPQIRVVAAGAGRILTRVSVFHGAIVTRRAANDASMQLIQRQLEALRRAA